VAKAPLSLPGARALGAPGHGAAGATPATEFKTPLGGITPVDLRGGYGLSGAPAPSPTQTVGIVDAYDDPSAEADLASFSSQFGLPPCTEAEGCFRKVNEKGNAAPLPPWKGSSSERGWALEIATDIETVHAVCPSCHIVLVEANSSLDTDLFAAEEVAAAQGASEISNSWGGAEPGADAPAFNHQGVVITASSGDSGYLNWLSASGHFADYPASSPHVVAVGGTRLLQSAGTWEAETVWNDGGEEPGGKKTGAGASGGGCSAVFAAPLWQTALSDWGSVGCVGRAVADVSADGDPYTGVDVYDSTATAAGNKGWAIVGGTSVASPIVAAVFALAGGAHGVDYPARTLYENAAAATPGLHDVSAGSNGKCALPFDAATGTSGCTSAEEAASCATKLSCLAGAGYDGPSGVGTPNGTAAFQPGGAVEGEPPAHEQPAHEATSAASGAGSPPPTSPAPPTSPGPAQAAPSARPPVISALALTRRALIALARARPRASRVGFTFLLSSPAQVSVSFARWTRARRSARWRRAAPAMALSAAQGRTSAHLSGHGGLSPGLYRITITPAAGAPASISFHIG
jgi:hypothetical protein